LIIMGVISQVMFLEARARYLYSFSTFYMIGASLGAYSLRYGLSNVKRMISHRNI